jgi:hypothetical protein
MPERDQGETHMNRWIFDPMTRVVLSTLVLLSIAGCGESRENNVSPLTGKVSVPLEGARLYIYGENEDIYGPAGYVSEPTGPDGSFSLSLKPGTYVGVVRKRTSGDAAGPVRIGDYRSEPTTIEVSADRTVVLDLTATVKVANEKVFPAMEAEGRTGLAGRVLDADGSPVEGVRVNVYDHIQMSERPKYVSEKTGPDGRFLVKVRRCSTGPVRRPPATGRPVRQVR